MEGTPREIFELKQQALEIHDDLSPYEGQWVVIRDGHVVAYGRDTAKLRELPNVLDSDIFVTVPPPGLMFYEVN
jgi:hypothetical protein